MILRFIMTMFGSNGRDLVRITHAIWAALPCGSPRRGVHDAGERQRSTVRLRRPCARDALALEWYRGRAAAIAASLRSEYRLYRNAALREGTWAKSAPYREQLEPIDQNLAAGYRRTPGWDLYHRGENRRGQRSGAGFVGRRSSVLGPFSV